MRDNLININWTAAPLSGQQRFVIHQLAVLFLKTRGERDYIDFTHELIDGRLHKKKYGVFGTYAGTFFHVDMDEVNGVPWTLDFLLPTSALGVEYHEGDTITGLTWQSDGRVALSQFDPPEGRATAAAFLN